MSASGYQSGARTALGRTTRWVIQPHDKALGRQ